MTAASVEGKYPIFQVTEYKSCILIWFISGSQWGHQ